MQQLSFKSLYQPWNLSKLQDLSERNKEKCKKMKNKHQMPTLRPRNTLQSLFGEWYHLLGHHLCKHKYDLERNKMRMRDGWLWDNMKNESARVFLR